MRDRIGAVALALLLTCAAAAAQSARNKPQPPVGVDPGGTAIGLVTTGIDYTLPPVARCLARDGEGRLIAWDVVDRDPLPYKARAIGAFDDGVLASAVDCGGRVRVVPVRADPADPVTISRSLAFLSTTPARLVVLPARNAPADWRPFLAAAAEFKRLLIIVATTVPVAAHPVANQSNVALVSAASGDEASLLALAHAVMLVACDANARDSSLTGAALARRLAEQVARSPAPPVGEMLSPKCR